MKKCNFKSKYTPMQRNLGEWSWEQSLSVGLDRKFQMQIRVKSGNGGKKKKRRTKFQFQVDKMEDVDEGALGVTMIDSKKKKLVLSEEGEEKENGVVAGFEDVTLSKGVVWSEIISLQEQLREQQSLNRIRADKIIAKIETKSSSIGNKQHIMMYHFRRAKLRRRRRMQNMVQEPIVICAVCKNQSISVEINVCNCCGVAVHKACYNEGGTDFDPDFFCQSCMYYPRLPQCKVCKMTAPEAIFKIGNDGEPYHFACPLKMKRKKWIKTGRNKKGPSSGKKKQRALQRLKSLVKLLPPPPYKITPALGPIGPIEIKKRGVKKQIALTRIREMISRLPRPCYQAALENALSEINYHYQGHQWHNYQVYQGHHQLQNTQTYQGHQLQTNQTHQGHELQSEVLEYNDGTQDLGYEILNIMDQGYTFE
eukprot:g4601.t1